MENQLKDMLLKLFINRVGTARVNEIKSLAIDIMLNPDLDKDKLGTRFFFLAAEYHGGNTRNLQDLKKNSRHLLNMDIDKTLEKCNNEGSNYVSFYKEFEVVDVDLFREARFACKDLLTGEIKYFDKLKGANIGDIVPDFFVKEEIEVIQEEIVKSVDIDSLLNLKDKLEN